MHVESVVELVLDTGSGKPLESVAVVGLSMIASIYGFRFIFHLCLSLSFSTTKIRRADNASAICKVLSDN